MAILVVTQPVAVLSGAAHVSGVEEGPSGTEVKRAGWGSHRDGIAYHGDITACTIAVGVVAVETAHLIISPAMRGFIVMTVGAYTV
jgi:hypothetical protein